MLETLRNAWRIDEIRKKLIYTFVVIVLFRIGSAIPVPYVDSVALGKYFSDTSVSTSLLGYFNLLSGDAFSKATLFALSITPYITASIVMQLLTVAIPALERLQKSGPDGQDKIKKITRYVTVVLALVTAYGYYLTLKNTEYAGYGCLLRDTGWFACIVIVASFSAGAYLVMWMGEKIDAHGIGNGISIILFVNIVSRAPAMLSYAWEYLKTAFEGEIQYLFYLIFITLFMLAVVTLVVFITNSERRLPVQYAKRQVGRKMYGGMNTHLPIKLNMSGVMPIIFAQAIVSIPATLALIFKSWSTGINDWFSAASKWPFYAIVYFLLIIAFAYFYNSISFNPVEVANNIRKNGGTILGYRPGKPTADYIKKVLNRITFIGALFLGFIAVFPILLAMTGNPVFQAFAFGGSSLLIVVGVALETTRDLESQITLRHYKGFLE